jgi:hypothetical protein
VGTIKRQVKGSTASKRGERKFRWDGTYLEGDAWPSPLLKTVGDLSMGISPDGEEVEGAAAIAWHSDWEGDEEGTRVGTNCGVPQSVASGGSRILKQDGPSS